MRKALAGALLISGMLILGAGTILYGVGDFSILTLLTCCWIIASCIVKVLVYRNSPRTIHAVAAASFLWLAMLGCAYLIPPVGDPVVMSPVLGRLMYIPAFVWPIYDVVMGFIGLDFTREPNKA